MKNDTLHAAKLAGLRMMAKLFGDTHPSERKLPKGLIILGPHHNKGNHQRNTFVYVPHFAKEGVSKELRTAVMASVDLLNTPGKENPEFFPDNIDPTTGEQTYEIEKRITETPIPNQFRMRKEIPGGNRPEADH